MVHYCEEDLAVVGFFLVRMIQFPSPEAEGQVTWKLYHDLGNNSTNDPAGLMPLGIIFFTLYQIFDRFCQRTITTGLSCH